MDKFNSSKGFKKYVFAGSLILLFLGTLIMTSTVLAGFCPDLREYTCIATETCGGEITDSWEMCASLCIQNDGYAYFDADPDFHCNLGFLNSRELLGSGASIIEGGCFVNFSSRSITLDIVDIMENCIIHSKCKQCD